jgi:hypothetical protein
MIIQWSWHHHPTPLVVIVIIIVNFMCYYYYYYKKLYTTTLAEHTVKYSNENLCYCRVACIHSLQGD